jgi:hypothetical protein
MDKIYSHAHVTLIAAAGTSSLHGLLGVGGRYRHHQGRCFIDNVDIIQIFPHTSHQISISTWASRGWTYQEGYLSPRQLIFTDYEVSFLCNAMHHAESVQKPFDISKAEKKAEKEDFLNMIPSSSNSEARWKDLKHRQLAEYTKRSLTNDSDSLGAILGLFRTLETDNIRQLHGIPVRKALSVSRMSPQWPLAWHHDAEATRRPQFPSWSWSGWQGGMRMAETDICGARDCKIEVLKESGHILPLSTWLSQELRNMRNPELPSINAPHILRITAMAIPIKLEHKSWTERNENRSQKTKLNRMEYTSGLHAVLPICEDITAMARADMDENVLLESDLLGLVLRPRDWESATIRKRATILVLSGSGQHYQRVGLVRLPSNPKTHPAGGLDPQTIYVDNDGSILEEVSFGNEFPLWLRDAVERTVTIL